MQWLFNNSKAKAELTERDDGTSLTTVPISQRFPLFALLIGIVALPFFLFAFSNSGDHSWTAFAFTWLGGLFVFFLLWFSVSLSYLFSPRKYQLEIDQRGVRERTLLSERIWHWDDIVEIRIFSYDTSSRVGFLLKRKSWSRKLGLTSFDAVLVNSYALPDHEIVRILWSHEEVYVKTLIQKSENKKKRRITMC